MFHDEDLMCWEIFVSLYKTGFIYQTAEELGLDSPMVSKKLTYLEKKLGKKLFNRNKRPFEKTEAAYSIYRDAELLVSSRSHISDYFEESRNSSNSVLRIMIGNSYRKIAPSMITEYHRKYPNMRFNMISPIDIEEFRQGKADIICISGEHNLPGTIMIPRGKVVFVPVASPSYLKKHAPINRPEDLSKHIVFSNLYANRFSFSVTYPLKKGNQLINYTTKEKIRWSSVDMAKEAVIEGLGISPCLPLFLCIDDLESGALVPILDGWHRPSHMNYLACRKEDWRLPHIRSFISWWSEKLIKVGKDCEKRYIKLFGKSNFNNLIN